MHSGKYMTSRHRHDTANNIEKGSISCLTNYLYTMQCREKKKNAANISKLKLTYWKVWRVTVNPSVWGRGFLFPAGAWASLCHVVIAICRIASPGGSRRPLRSRRAWCSWWAWQASSWQNKARISRVLTRARAVPCISPPTSAALQHIQEKAGGAGLTLRELRRKSRRVKPVSKPGGRLVSS